MRIKSLSPNNIIGRHLTTQNRIAPPKMPKKDKGHHKMKVTHNAKDKQAKLFFSEISKACTTKDFIY
jgi:hypothetical protein